MIEIMVSPFDLDTTPLSVQCKQALRDNIQTEVDAFLKDGGTVKSLDFGFTCYRDGDIPVGRSVSRSCKKSPPREVITALPQKKQVAVKPKATDKIKDKMSQEKRERLKIVNELKKAAIASGLREFIGPCAIHKNTKYGIRTSGVARCKLCAQESKIHSLDLETRLANKLRKGINQNRLNKAISLNKMEFIGCCINCGDAPFKVRMLKTNKTHGHIISYNYACIACFKKSVRLSESKRRNKKNYSEDVLE